MWEIRKNFCNFSKMSTVEIIFKESTFSHLYIQTSHAASLTFHVIIQMDFRSHGIIFTLIHSKEDEALMCRMQTHYEISFPST